MVFVPQDLGFHPLELPDDGGFIIVVKSLAFPANLQAHRDVEAILASAIQQLLATLAAILRPPGAEGVAAVFGQFFLAARSQPGTLDIERLAVHAQKVSALGVADFNLRGALGWLWVAADDRGGEAPHQAPHAP